MSRCRPSYCTARPGALRDRIARGDDVDGRDRARCTPLRYACGTGHQECAQALIDAGAAVDEVNNCGMTGLMWACITGRHECAQALIDTGAAVDVVSNYGWTALMKACDKGRHECTRALIASTEHGQTTQYALIDSTTSYIVKPNRGLGGQGIRSMKGDDVLQLLRQKHEDLIVQERLYACHSAQSFRFVSLFDGTPFVMWQLINNTSFVSNYDNGRSHGEVSLCVETCVGLNEEEHAVLREMARSLSAVHVARFSKVFSIGWDLMLDCRTKTAFALEGNISHASWFGNFPNLIDEYKRRCADFHRI